MNHEKKFGWWPGDVEWLPPKEPAEKKAESDEEARPPRGAPDEADED